MKIKSMILGAVAAITLSLSSPSQASGNDFWLVNCSKDNGSLIWIEMTYSTKARNASMSRCFADGGSPSYEYVF